MSLAFICLAVAALADQSATGYEPEFTVAVIGDCLPGHHYNRLIKEGLDPFRDLRPILAGADLAAANLECPLTDRGRAVPGKRFTFRGDPKHATLLAEGGLDVLGLANNHIMDFGVQGLEDTMDSLSKAGLFWCGAGMNKTQARRAASLKAGGARVAFLAYNRTLPKSYWVSGSNPGVAFASEADVGADVGAARSSHDVVVVMLHGGRERTYDLRDYQLGVARAAAESGAVLVVGSHPHVAQGVQRIGRSVVAYSLGDGLFGGAWRRSEDGLLLRAFFAGGELRSVEFLAVDASIASTGGIPAIRKEEGPAVLARVQALSGDLGTAVELARSKEGWPCVRLELDPGNPEPALPPTAPPDQENGQEDEEGEQE